MSDLNELFPGFDSHWIDTDHGRIFARSGGEGPPVVLLHGFPQTHVMWHRIAGRLSRRFRVVAMDLRGYGWSSIPRSDAQHRPFSKRAMAKDVITVMETLGHAQFAAVGHDRGGRVAYRLALDEPGRLSRLAVLDIVPTAVMWEQIEASPSPRTEHWRLLAEPEPIPERQIAAAAVAYLEGKLAGWSGTGSLSAFDARALAAYRAAFNDPARIHACCEDYRAGATVDRADDEADRAAGRRIEAPLLALWGNAGIPAAGRRPLDVWRDWARHVSGQAIESGHFLPEENPDDTAGALENFLAEG